MALIVLTPSRPIFTHYQNDPDNNESISNNVINDLLFDSNYNLWIATEDGLNLL